VYTRGLTLFLSASAFDLLQSSSAQPAYTPLVNTMYLPSGETVTPLAPVARFVNCFGSEPSAFMLQTCDVPLRVDV